MFCQNEGEQDKLHIEESILQAVQDYDKMVFGLINMTSFFDLVYFLPDNMEFDKASLERLQERDQNYDEFNLLNFYDFCLMNPIDGSTTNKYVFAEKQRSQEMDKKIIAIWIQNHLSEK
jgi:hypothetical protein